MARTAELPPEIIDLEDYTETINVLCHADTGGGKTVLWGALPNILILAIEEGTISAKRVLPPPKAGTLRKVVRVRSWAEIVKWFQWLRDNDHPFEWVMIDSITKAQYLCIKHIMEMVVKANPSRDPLIPSQGDHFKWQLSMKQLVSDFNDLPVNVVWLARSMIREDADANEIVVPLIEGKDYQISAWVCGEMHLLCYLKKEKKGGKIVRRLYTNDHDRYWCKDRYNVLPHVIESPDANKIVRLIVQSGASPEVERRSARPSATKTAAKRRPKKE
jgi:hypothetical protein